MSERDTHFLGFARALLNEILDEREGSLILGSDLYPQDNERVAQHIAQRAYDLVWHTLHAVGLDDDSIPFQDVYRPEEDIPDMDKWPE